MPHNPQQETPRPERPVFTSRRIVWAGAVASHAKFRIVYLGEPREGINEPRFAVEQSHGHDALGWPSWGKPHQSDLRHLTNALANELLKLQLEKEKTE